MTSTPAPEGDEVKTRSFYLSEDLPTLYVSLPAGPDPALRAQLVSFCRVLGLHEFDAAAAIADGRGGISQPSLAGWRVVFEHDLGDEQPPLMTIEWPANPGPMVWGVRKDSPATWSTDAIVHGQIALIVGPPVDWDAMTVTLGEGPGLTTIGSLLHAIAGRPAAAGLLSVTVLA